LVLKKGVQNRLMEFNLEKKKAGLGARLCPELKRRRKGEDQLLSPRSRTNRRQWEKKRFNQGGKKDTSTGHKDVKGGKNPRMKKAARREMNASKKHKLTNGPWKRPGILKGPKNVNKVSKNGRVHKG